MYQNKLVDWIAELARRAARALEDVRCRLALGRELADLENRHLLAATLDDIGLSRGQLPGLVRGFPQRQRLFRRMLARRGASTGGLNRAVVNDMVWTCTTCGANKTCRSWLDAGHTRGAEAFCPNAGTIEKLAKSAWPRPRRT